MTADDSKNVLIYADPLDVVHKRQGNVPDGHECYWTVNGTPRQTAPGASVLFTHGERVYASAKVVAVEEGRLWFTPLEGCDRKLPADPVTRGYKYVSGGEV